MLKLKTTLTAFATVVGLVFATSTPTLTASAALPAPAAWDYAYKYNATNDEFEFTRYDASASNTPVYTRTVNGAYYNYTYTGDGNDTLPFDVNLIFYRSNTSWKEYGGGYTSDDTKIGSDNTVGAGSKYEYLLTNDTNRNYKMILDRSSSGGSDYAYIRYPSINTSTNFGGQYQGILLGYTSNSENAFLVPAFTSFRIIGATRTLNEYFDAMYLFDLGVSSAYTTGVTDTESDIQTLINEAYLNGYQEALDMQTADALTNGASIFIGLILMLFLTFIGMGKKIFILNVLAIAGTIFFAIAANGSMPLIILSVGFILFNIYIVYNGLAGE